MASLNLFIISFYKGYGCLWEDKRGLRCTIASLSLFLCFRYWSSWLKSVYLARVFIWSSLFWYWLKFKALLKSCFLDFFDFVWISELMSFIFRSSSRNLQIKLQKPFKKPVNLPLLRLLIFWSNFLLLLLKNPFLRLLHSFLRG